MPFAVGMYLPFSLNAGIMAGGLVRLFMDKRNVSEKEKKVSAIKLDDYGSFLWQSINDQKTVHQLSLDLQSQFPKMEKPLARLIRFLEILKDHHLIELKEVY